MDYSTLCGWADRPKDVEKVVACQAIPIFSNILKDSGKGKTITLWQFIEQVTGQPFKPRFQEIGDCFVSGTKVLMADGSSKNIEDVQVGEYVVTHLGNIKMVTSRIDKKYTGDIYTFKCNGNINTIQCTPDHRFYKANHEKRNGLINLGWLAINKIDTLTQKILIPYGLQSNQYHTVSYNDYNIVIDETFARLFGLYLAEGGIDGHDNVDYRITFSLNRTEESVADFIIETIQNLFGYKCTKLYCDSKPNVLLVRCNNKKIAEYFKQLCKQNIYNKYIHPIFFNSPNSVKIELLRGWLIGDGCKQINNIYNITGVSVSKQLIIDFIQLSNSLGIRNTSVIRPAYKQSKESYSIDFYGNDAYKIFSIENEFNSKNHKDYNELGFFKKIEFINIHIVNNINVYCLEVEDDHSFIANNYAVHNCVSMGAALAVDIVKATQSVLLKTYEDWVAETATEPIYWLSRCEIGRFQLRGSDGSTGGWAAEAVKQYGTLARNKYGSFNLTKYSGRMASMYADKGCPDELETVSKEHKIKYVSLIQTWEDVRDAVANGYPITIASNRGFSNRRDNDGFAAPKGTWPHQMCIAGIKDDKRPGALIINSWGSDWIAGPKFLQPEGSFWCDADVLEKHILSANDSWVFSGFEGYPPQKISWDII